MTLVWRLSMTTTRQYKEKIMLFSTMSHCQPKTEKYQAISTLIQLVRTSQERGAYQLEEAVQWQQAILLFLPQGEKTTQMSTSKDTSVIPSVQQQEKAAHTLIQALEISQKKGKLTLQEAWEAMNGIKILSSPEDNDKCRSPHDTLNVLTE